MRSIGDRKAMTDSPDAFAPTGSPRTPESRTGVPRREFFALASVLGLAAAIRPGSLVARQEEDDEPITLETIRRAENVLGLELTDEERELMIEGLEEQREAYAKIRAAAPPNAIGPALRFDPVPAGRPDPPPAGSATTPIEASDPGPLQRPSSLEEVAFWPVTRLSALVRSGAVSSVELTEMYLDRLERHGPALEAVVTLTPERALEQARRADAELEAGRWHGPLHGVPWGAKDLLAARGYPTTWGAKPYAEQTIEADAMVVRRLEAAGAVLVAKLTLGALAWGDVWFGGQTKNPWNLGQGSSGSSAGSAAATVAGLVGFAIGSETLGSIVSPCTRTGATGHRPTFGRVPRTGAMALAWSMDKLGPIARSVEDCAIVFDAIRGPDGRDPTVRDAPFEWTPGADLEGRRIGFLESAFDATEDHDTKPFDDTALEVLRDLGAELVPIELPDDPPVEPLSIILTTEAAAAFDELTRSGRDDLLVRQIADAWPNVFRQSRFIPAVEYVQANRLRTLLMRAMEDTLAEVDVFVAPSFADRLLLTTNLTGHPAVVVPNGFTDEGTPVSITFSGRLYADDRVLAVARAYQDATGFHRKRPPGFS